MNVPARSFHARSKVLALIIMLSFVAVFSDARITLARNRWTEQTGSPVGFWRTIRSSANGSDLVADVYNTDNSTDALYLSRDGGASWINIAPYGLENPTWNDLGISADGNTVVAVDTNDGGLIWTGFVTYTPNFSVNWNSENGDGVTSPGGANWGTVSIADNGTYVAAVDPNNDAIWVTDDHENTWQRVEPYAGAWVNAVFSPDGGTLAAANNSGHIVVSRDAGQHWTATSTQTSVGWDSLAVANNGTIVTSRTGEPILVGTNYGATWASTGFDGAHVDRVAISDDGTHMAATQNSGYIATADASDITTWTLQLGDGTPDAGQWFGLAFNVSGTKLVAGSYDAHTWLFEQPFDTTAPSITILGDSPASLTQGAPYTDAGATALDGTDGDLTGSITVDSNVNANVVGSYRVVYTVVDAAYNEVSSMRTVTVVPRSNHHPSSSASFRPTGPTATSSPVTLTNSYQFTRNLKVGMSGADVQELQKFLNSHGFPVALSGPGSLGNETSLFGALTRKALAAYQKSQGIIPSVGYFGPLTRANINSKP